VLSWARAQWPGLKLGLLGASNGAEAALLAAIAAGPLAQALVLRTGAVISPMPGLERVSAPTLITVAGDDPMLVTAAHELTVRIPVETDLEIIPGLGTGFDEPAAREAAAHLAADWFHTCFRHSSRLALRRAPS
jgi:dienelactone hydrolase